MGCEDHRGDVWLLVVDSFGRRVVGFRDADEASTFLGGPLIRLALVVRQLGPRGGTYLYTRGCGPGPENGATLRRTASWAICRTPEAVAETPGWRLNTACG